MSRPTTLCPLLEIPYAQPLLEGRLVRRYNRFMADVALDGGRPVVAHCVNTGRMEGLVKPGARVWLSHCPSPTRKLHYTWEIVEIDGVLIGANTSMPNRIVGQLLRERLLPGFRRWSELRPEFRLPDGSRMDFHLLDHQGEQFIEVKNCHLVYPDCRGYFPDSVSARATKHLEHLGALARAGHRASVIFTAQHGEAKSLRPSDLHDPAFADAARRVSKDGVRFHAVRIRPTPAALVVECTIPVDLRPYKLAPLEKWKKERDPFSGWQQVRAGQ